MHQNALTKGLRENRELSRAGPKMAQENDKMPAGA